MSCSLNSSFSSFLAAGPDKASIVSQEQKAKADEKESIVRENIQNIEHAMQRNQREDREWLQQLIVQRSECFITLVKIVISSKWEVFVRLRCMVLRALQLMMRVARTFVTDDHAQNPNLGMLLFREMAGEELADQAYPIIAKTALEHEESVLSCDALLVLSEMGAEALEPKTVTERMLELMAECHDRLHELAEVAMKIHRYGGRMRQTLLEVSLTHPGGRHLSEALVQVCNREKRGEETLRAAKMITGCISAETGTRRFLFTNDARVLVEVLFQRHLPNAAQDPERFGVFAAMLKAMYSNYSDLQSHHRDQICQVLSDLRDHDEQTHPLVRSSCAEVLGVMNGGGLYSGIR